MLHCFGFVDIISSSNIALDNFFVSYIVIISTLSISSSYHPINSILYPKTCPKSCKVSFSPLIMSHKNFETNTMLQAISRGRKFLINMRTCAHDHHRKCPHCRTFSHISPHDPRIVFFGTVCCIWYQFNTSRTFLWLQYN